MIFYQMKIELIQTKRKAYECIKIEGIDENPAYLSLYYYKNKNSFVISYIHDKIKATRELPDYIDNNIEINNADEPSIINGIELYNISNNECVYNTQSNFLAKIVTNDGCNNNEANLYKIVIPIIGSDGKDYSILISYYGKVTVTAD